MVNRIKELCARDGISLHQLETTVGIGNGVIARWDKSSPKVDNVLLVANYFGVSVEWIITGSLPTVLSRDALDIAIQFDALDARDQALIRSMMDSMKKNSAVSDLEAAR